MEDHFLEIEFSPDRAALVARMGLEAGSEEAGEFLALLDRIVPLARPKGFIGRARLDSFDGDGRCVIEGVPFHSRLLAEQLAGRNEVWPYIATCGKEVHEFAMAIGDPFERYWVDEIMQEALTAARTALASYLAENIYSGMTAAMSPGSLPEWPIEEQKPLFRLLDAAAGKCGVTLTESLLMLPHKSVSGIRFANEHGFVSCRLCPREKCSGRQAPYDEKEAALVR